MERRELKQITYGGIIFIFIFGVIWLIGSATQDKATCYDNIKNQREIKTDCGGPCLPCDNDRLHQIIFGERTIFPHFDINKTSFYFHLINENSAFWAEDIRYRLNIYNNHNRKIDSIYGVLSVPPAAITNNGKISGIAREIIVAENIAPTEAARINIEIIENNWREAETYIDARLSITEARFTESNGRIIVRGTVKNNSLVKYEAIKVGIIFKDIQGEKIGVSRVTINDVASFAESNFEIFWRNDTGRIIDYNQSEIFAKRQ